MTPDSTDEAAGTPPRDDGQFVARDSWRGRLHRLARYVRRLFASQSNTTGEKSPALITYLIGPDYEGPFSDFDEWHAAEYGALIGFAMIVVVLAPGLGTAIAGALGITGGKRLLTGEMRRQITSELHYLGGTAVLTFFSGLGLIAFVRRVGIMQVLL